jgi:hypothetical protein
VIQTGHGFFLTLCETGARQLLVQELITVMSQSSTYCPAVTPDCLLFSDRIFAGSGTVLREILRGAAGGYMGKKAAPAKLSYRACRAVFPGDAGIQRSPVQNTVKGKN